ncbi:pheromone processing endoprotease [Zalaria obscura]|uniref:Pheromone processing endoprotease n=1 Tax=Zalaria obscura TaxID=2024903 RepID=A0ACC3SPU7_9PEZI
MRTAVLLQLLAATASWALSKRDYDSYDYYAVHLDQRASPEDLATHLGFQLDGQIGELQHHYLLKAPKTDDDLLHGAIQDLKSKRRKRQLGTGGYHILDGVLLNQKQERRKKLFKREEALERDLEGTVWSHRADSDMPVDSKVQEGLDLAKALGIKDPIFQDQWHLFNHVETGHDLNVSAVWAQGITGKNSTVCIVDDGLDMDSDDLKDNYFAAGSYDFNDQVDDPKPRLSDDRHGTRCAGEVAAVRNDVCGVGVAYDSKVAGVRILSALISDADEATAMNYAYQENQIYSCSWGPPDDGRSMEAPGILIKRAMVTGVQKGRQGRGSIYVFAIGNGAANDDNCNFDGYTNSIYSVSVGGIDRKGLHPYYSEKCSAQLVVTYSSGSGDAIHTTDVGKDSCYSNHGGTSAAGPLVAGVYALMLEVRPDLTWRDIQWLTVLTAIPLDDEPSDWQDTPLGVKFSHQFGYGKIDAWRIVEAAKNWTNVKPQAWYYSPWLHVRKEIPQGDTGLTASFEVTEAMLNKANLGRLEHVTVTMNVEHTRRGDLSVELRSPTGIISHIATNRRNDEFNGGYVDWNFMSVAHWGESGIGRWTIVVKDTNVNEHSGKFTDWRLRLWGESMDPAIQKLLPLPDDHDDDDHDAETTSAAVGTTSVDVPTQTGSPAGNPSDHITRPVNNKVSSTTVLSSPTSTSTTTAATPVEPAPTDDNIDDHEEEKPAASATAAPGHSNFLPSPFPTFGVSKHTQIWIYGALALIATFCTSLTVWYILTRRRRQKNARDEYEFEMLDEEDDDEGGRGAANGSGMNGAKGKRRAGELYDAFAEGSEDEDVFSLGDEDEEDDRYRDEERRSAEGEARGSEERGRGRT